MNFRQVHLDFHTSEKIPDIGSEFSKEDFQSALKIGHINSITVFAKCHHGWSYHPTKVGEMHPNLNFDLLGAQIEAAHEIGVKTPVYLSAGFDEKTAWEHPEWLLRPDDDAVHFNVARYHHFCLNSPYLGYFLAQIREVLENYDTDGIFLDIVNANICRCRNCVRDMVFEGLDPYDNKDAQLFADKVYENYARKVREIVDSVKPGHPVFHNGGHIKRGRRDLAAYNTHLELESLPTGGWGYDHFPLSASYSDNLGYDYLGMTGKFHGTWGEFGGIKHPNALLYECALNCAFGAKSSIGDQLHPSGKTEAATYFIIGKAYEYVEKIEPWLDSTHAVADVALFSAEAADSIGLSRAREIGLYEGTVDAGGVRILLEGKYLFSVVDADCDFSAYKVLILPDCVCIDEKLREKLSAFANKGGKILATGMSALSTEGKDILGGLGVKSTVPSSYTPVYLKAQFDTSFPEGAFVIYAPSYDVTAEDGAKVIIKKENPYFNRTPLSFSSHAQTPNDKTKDFPIATIGENGAYIGAALFSEYASVGSIITKKILCGVLDMLLGNSKTVLTNLPVPGIITLRKQENANRLVLHALYASPVKRGTNVEVIEDIVPIYDTSFRINLDRAPKKLYAAPQMTDIPFTFENGVLSFNAKKIDCHFMAVMEF